MDEIRTSGEAAKAVRLGFKEFDDVALTAHGKPG
jgi:hypothetical protein